MDLSNRKRVTYPRRILCLSGKRKSGKDYVAELLHAKLPESIIIRISAPIKKHWAELNELDLNQLMSDGSYKEKHRIEMIHWGEEKRATDPGFFCRSAIEMQNANEFPIWIVSDLRRSTDLEFFLQSYPEIVSSVRINASNEARARRGFVSIAGVDDAESECGLDHITNWNFIINNDGSDSAKFQEDLNGLVNICQKALQ